MQHFGPFGQVGAVGYVKIEFGRDLDRLVTADAVLAHVVAVEVHIDWDVVGLRHPVLKPRRNVQLVPLGGEDHVGEHRRSELDMVEFHHRPHRGGDDRRRPRQPEPVRNRARIADREVLLLQPDLLRVAEVVEFLHRRLEQPDAAVVAVLFDIRRERVDAGEYIVVALRRQEFEFGRFVKFHFRLVVAEDEGDGFAVVAVGGISDQRRARVGDGSDDHAGRFFREINGGLYIIA
ncbi:hypothetical protein SDC9_149746 [bioreactor metagenome]|uniref:Uncharacterized protein n=1 Tax=bioreactor metagenome TaxID=1076179 RepID=A0A645EMD8_9ZZZZ